MEASHKYAFIIVADAYTILFAQYSLYEPVHPFVVS